MVLLFKDTCHRKMSSLFGSPGAHARTPRCSFGVAVLSAAARRSHQRRPSFSSGCPSQHGAVGSRPAPSGEHPLGDASGSIGGPGRENEEKYEHRRGQNEVGSLKSFGRGADTRVGFPIMEIIVIGYEHQFVVIVEETIGPNLLDT